MDEIKKIELADENYPEILKKIKNPPKELYYKGELKNHEPCLAIVGTRRHTDYGKQVTLQIASQLAESGITIVSGLAPGIDTFGHTAAVNLGKRTIAVLGSGIDEKSLYPKENIILARKIVANGGCLISEYVPGTRGAQFTFPNRNRIISGLSLGVLVIEAKEKSGSLITANWAFSQKKKVFAVPGSVYSINSKGPHALLKMGAKLVDKAEDILIELGLTNLNRQKTLRYETADKANPEEMLVLNLIKEQPLDIDKIIERTKLNAATAARIITVLEINGKIKCLGKNVYRYNI